MIGDKLFTRALFGSVFAISAMYGNLNSANAQSTQLKNVEIVLDASGSMNGKLRDGTRKMVAAKQAVEKFVGKLPGDINLSLRAYGHQSHRSKHNCKDTALIVPFGNVAQVSSDVIASSKALDAQGYTPITYVLGLAADDLKPLAGKKTIVLVSDGKETCEGDPCLLAQKLADANADLTIHTVGLGVDFQTKTQLQCIANVGRGKYFDANSTDELASSMEEATIAELKEPETETITIKIAKPKFGHLKVENGTFHRVFDAETGEKVGTASKSNKNLVKLKPGIYNVQFGKNLMWKSIQILGDETTTISAGILKINNNQYHKIFDPETDQNYLTYGSSDKEVALPPGIYEVGFDKARWQNVVITEGETTLLEPAILKIANNQYHRVRDVETGKNLMTYSSSTKYLAVPPGTYDVSFDKAVWKNIKLEAGKETVLKPAVLKIANNQYHQIYDVKSGEKVMTYSSSTKSLTVPPGEYEVAFYKTRWKINLEEGKALVLNPGGFKVTPQGYYKFYFADSGKIAGTLSSSDKQAMLTPGKYVVKIGEQDVPLNITEGKIININLE